MSHLLCPACYEAIDQFSDPWLEIDTQRLRHNLEQVRQKAGNRPLMAVVKCNAYGHGLPGIAKALSAQGVDHFAVFKVYEALTLRENGIPGMILNFGSFSAQEAELLVNRDISASVFSDAVDLLAAAARKQGKQARVHIKIDTGLGRVGIPYSQALNFIEKVARMPEIILEGLFTTLTEEEDFDPLQEERLCRIASAAQAQGISTGLRHAVSSCGLAHYPASQYLDMVRCGNALFGFEALPGMDLKAILSFKTRIILLKTLSPGDTLGYHRAYKIERDMRVATLSLGYSDGYPFQAIPQAQVLVNGKRCPMLNMISANHTYVDVTDLPDVQVGDEVVLFGEQEHQTLLIGELARWAGSSEYKIGAGLSPFLPRLYR